MSKLRWRGHSTLLTLTFQINDCDSCYSGTANQTEDAKKLKVPSVIIEIRCGNAAHDYTNSDWDAAAESATKDLSHF